jgi:transcriptional regulator with XRE-family HTH domain
VENQGELLQDPQYLQALIRATLPVVALPSGDVCRDLREFSGVSQKLAAVVCGVGINTIQRWESGAVTHSRALDHQAYRSLLAALLWYAQSEDPDFAAAIRREWPVQTKSDNKDAA